MIVTDRLIFIQLPKTGCSHIASSILSIAPGKKIGGKHNRLPNSFDTKGKYIVGSIRDPWDWYISLWAFGCEGKGKIYKNLTSRSLKGKGITRNPVQFLIVALEEMKKSVSDYRQVYSDSYNPNLFRKWLRLVLDPSKKCSLRSEYGFSKMSSFAGLLTFEYVYLFWNSLLTIHRLENVDELLKADRTSNVLDATIRCEFLMEDLVDTLDKAGYHLGESQLQKLQGRKKINVSPRNRSLNFYYDRDTAKLVEEKEKFIVEKYGYKLPCFNNALEQSSDNHTLSK